MKIFEFPLDKVLNYKEQIENNLKSEHAQIIKSIADKEKEKQELEGIYAQKARQREQQMTGGLNAASLQMYDRYFQRIMTEVEEKQDVIERLRTREESKRKEVIHARMETASIEKLKEKKLQEYEQAVQKSEEQMIEEFVSNQSGGLKDIRLC